MKRFARLACIASLFAGSAFAVAQSQSTSAPAAQASAPVNTPTATPAATPTTASVKPGYSGPSGAPLMSVKDLLAKGKDDQFVRLQGKLTSHKGDDDYEFTDASGKIMVEIDADRFPQGVTVDHNTTVELSGEFDKEMFGDATLDVEQIKVIKG